MEGAINRPTPPDRVGVLPLCPLPASIWLCWHPPWWSRVLYLQAFDYVDNLPSGVVGVLYLQVFDYVDILPSGVVGVLYLQVYEYVDNLPSGVVGVLYLQVFDMLTTSLVE